MAAFLIIWALYLLFALALLIRRPAASSAGDWQPSVSVIVAARNEERLLPACLQALADLDYLPPKLEIILVNDASTDATGRLMREVCAKDPRFKLVELAPGEKRKIGKAGALLAGIERSRGEVICITDADCRPSPSWVRGLTSMFTPQTAVAGGFTVLEPSRGAIQAVQALDWLFLQSAASTSASYNLPISWFGNNLAFRRQAYEQVGGYEGIRDSLVEDFALINAVRRQTAWRFAFYPSPASMVRSVPAATLADLYRQRRRWSTGVSQTPPFGSLLMIAAAAAHLTLLIGLLTTPWAFAALAAKTALDGLMIGRAAKRLHVCAPMSYLLLFEVYFILYTLVMPLLMLVDRKIVWKDAQFDAEAERS